MSVGAEHALVYFPFDLAQRLGYFDREGLDVELCGGPVLLDRNPRSLSGSLQATLDSVLVFFIVAAATAVENVDDVEKYSLHVYAA